MGISAARSILAAMAKAILIHSHGGPDEMKFEDVAESAPGPGQARVRHQAIGINFIDVYHRTGLYPVPSLPGGLGLEAAGVVEAVGEAVMDVRVGDRVAYAGGAIGAYAEVRNLAADRLVKLPDGIESETAAAMMLKGMTVDVLIHRVFRVEPGQTVLWHAAAGGVGLIACQWLARLGVRVIGTVGSEVKAALARANGCAETIVYTKENFVERVLELTHGEKLPVVFDSVGKSTFLGSLDCLRPRGLYVGFGNASGKPDPFDITQLGPKGSLYLTRPTLFTYTAAREDLLASATRLFDMVSRDAVKIHITKRFALAEAARAHAHLESRQSSGSLLLVP